MVPVTVAVFDTVTEVGVGVRTAATGAPATTENEGVLDAVVTAKFESVALRV